LLAEAKAKEEESVVFWWQHRRLPYIAGEHFPKRRLRRDLGRNQMRRMIMVGGNLYRQLPPLAQGGCQAAQQRRVIGHPLQGGVGEDEIVISLSRECINISRHETESITSEGRRLGQHCRRAIEAQRLPRVEMDMQLPRQLARATPQIDHPHPRPRLHQGHEIEEGLRSLTAKPAVLLRIPICRG
jgi:hypothetical protein